MAPLLSAAGHVVAFDQRGHGESQKPAAGYDLPTMVGDLRGALAALDLEDAVVVGHSWGATVALAYAAQPETPGVVLVDGGLADWQGQPGASWERTERELAPPKMDHLRLDDLVAGMGRGRLSHLDPAFVRDFAASLMNEQPDGNYPPAIDARAAHGDLARDLGPATSRRARGKRLPHPGRHGGQRDRGRGRARGDDPADAAAGRRTTRGPVEWMPDTIHDVPLQRPRELADLSITGWMRAEGLIAP